MTTEDVDRVSFEGLSDSQARARLSAEGYNELRAGKRRSLFDTALEILREPMILLLMSAGAIYLVLGSLSEALVLIGSIFVVVGISLYQTRKTERALDALRQLASPRALVIRGGRQIRIPGREVVRDDLLILSQGDRIPADAILIQSFALAVDESLLTGESVSVRKRVPAKGSAVRGHPGGDDQPFLYASTLVVRGHGVARVTAVGAGTEVGRVGKALETIEPAPTRLETETRRLVQKIAVIGVGLCLAIVLIYGLSRGHWLEGLLSGLTLAMAILPEEFPIVLTVFLALGAWRISRNNVLTRRPAVLESLGAATVLCVDKTGTLTLNRMSVRKLVGSAGAHELSSGQDGGSVPEEFHEIIEYAILASQRDPADPMEQAIRALGRGEPFATDHMHGDWRLVREYPLSDHLLAMSHVWRSPKKNTYVVAAKGAPEAIVDLCHLDARRNEEVARQVDSLAKEGLRVLGVARAFFSESSLPGRQHDFDFELVGLLGFEDPIRSGVPEAVRECHAAGIRVVMITGDYAATATSIARQIGLAPAGVVLTGEQLDAMEEGVLAVRAASVAIYARVIPEQKLRLVEVLKANGEIVAMTGDGVNDAPALKAAQIGIAMGERGTDVAREAAGLVLLDDDFASLVRAVRLGRRIFDNLKKAMAYLIAVHVPIAGMSLLPVVFGWPIVLFPVHIVFLELIIDPACSIVFEAEPEEPGIMNRRPRNPDEPLLSARTVSLAFLQGASVLAIVLAVFLVALRMGRGPQDARTVAFVSLVLSNLALILSNRSWSRPIAEAGRRRNPALAWMAGAALLMLSLTLVMPPIRELFRFSALSSVDILVCVAASAAGVLWFEVFKLLRRRSGRARPGRIGRDGRAAD